MVNIGIKSREPWTSAVCLLLPVGSNRVTFSSVLS